MTASKAFSAILIICLGLAATASAASLPVIDSFAATPATPVPGQSVQLNITAHDPDCTASPCTTGCGVAIRGDLLVWSDDTGRTTSPFSGSTSSGTGSPWSASVTWIAPPAEGTYTVRANVADNGGMLCGGRQTKLATLQITVSSSRPPVIDSFTVTPASLMAGDVATLQVAAHDPLGRALSYSFSSDAGTIAATLPESPTATWRAPLSAGSIVLRCTVTATGGPAVTAQATANVAIGSFVRTLAIDGMRVTRVTPLPDGRLAAIDGVNGRLVVLSTSGQLSWSASQLATPVGIAAGGGEIFVVERAARKISVWSGSGAKVRELPLDLALPGQIAVGPNPGELVVCDHDAARIVVVSSTGGQTLRTIGSGLLKSAAGFAVNGGRMAIADPAASRILIFDAAGAHAATIGDNTTLVRPQGLAWDGAGARLVVADSFSGEIAIIGEEGAVRGSLGGFGEGEGRLVNPLDVALLPGGLLAIPTGGGEVPLFALQTTLAPLAAPTALVAGDRPGDDGGAIALSWTKSLDDPARITSYRIERAPGEADEFAVVETVARSTQSFVDQTVADRSCYRYRIIATDGTAEAASASTPCVAARNDLAPPQPAEVIAAVQSPTKTSLTWSPVTAVDLAGYLVELSGGAGAITQNVASTSVSPDGLEPRTTYNVAIRAIDTAGNRSLPAMTTFTTYSAARPPAPTGVIAEDAATGGAIRVAWTQPEADVPVASYRVDVTPATEGWPAASKTAGSTSAALSSLVNDLRYAVTVTALTPWGSESEPSTAMNVTPTAPVRPLPLIEATSAIEWSAGVTLSFAIEAEKRELRFEYLASGTMLLISIDGTSVGASLPDTGGVWTEAVLNVDKKLLKSAPSHLLALRSSGFPQANAQLALRRVDFVPLEPAQVRLDEYNSVADIVWAWQEARRDLGVSVARGATPLLCGAPATGRCRDVMLENEKNFVWSIAAVSPAGWRSASKEMHGRAKFADAPPPVTDLQVEPTVEGTRLTWTPLSSAAAKDAQPVMLREYRIYAAGALVATVAAPPALVPGDIDPATIVVRSVDSEGRESR